jgi:hypothetical protein
LTSKHKALSSTPSTSTTTTTNSNNNNKNQAYSGHSIILATKGAEAGRLQVQGQPRKHTKAIFKNRWVLVAHAYNPNYSGGLRFEASWGQIVHKTLSQINPSQKRAGGVAQDVSPEFKPQYHKKSNFF